jgi:hypothetical protein
MSREFKRLDGVLWLFCNNMFDFHAKTQRFSQRAQRCIFFFAPLRVFSLRLCVEFSSTQRRKDLIILFACFFFASLRGI